MRTTTWQYIFALLCFLGVFASATIIIMLFWMTDRINQVEHSKTHALIQLKIRETEKRLRLVVEDYAFWDFSHDLIKEGDPAAILENIGTGATETELFDQLFVVSQGGDLLHAFDEELGAEAAPLFTDAVLQSVWPEVSTSPPADQDSFTTFFEHEGIYSFLVAAWITPDDVATRTDEQYAALFGVIHLDEERLASMSQRVQVNSTWIGPPQEALVTDDPDHNLAVRNLRGVPVATLSWDMENIGSQLRQELLPGVLLMALGILGICGAAARYFWTQHMTLQRANKIAMTDQLTGLLNRAGLSERLRQWDVLRSLEDGHLAVLYLDLNKFKALNDTYGHQAGDVALRITSERLRSCVRSADIVARMGGDEFVCVILDKNAEEVAQTIAQRIIDISQSTFSFDSHDHIIAPSVGLAIARPGTQWETVLSQSDAAMYECKKASPDKPVVFCRSMDGGQHLAGAA